MSARVFWAVAAGVLVTASLLAGCGTTQVVRIPVDAEMDARDAPPPTTVKGVTVGFIRPVLKNSPSARVDLTSSFAESYPTRTHQAHAVPQALREVGFNVVEVADEAEARALKVQWVMALGAPEVDAVHPAQGDRTTLVGSGYDVRVHYRAVVRSVDGKLLGLVTGFGQDTNRFIFMEPLFREAVVGAFISVATLSASMFGLFLILQLGLLANLAGRGDVFGLCYQNPETGQRGPVLERMRRLPDPPPNPLFTKQDACIEGVNYAVYGAFGVAVSVFTSILGTVAGALGGNVIDVILAALHLGRVDPVWRGMVQDAHDEAARDLADDMAKRVLLAELAPAQARQFLPPPAPSALPPVSPDRPLVTPE